jgi:hypothetical protein
MWTHLTRKETNSRKVQTKKEPICLIAVEKESHSRAVILSYFHGCQIDNVQDVY